MKRRPFIASIGAIGAGTFSVIGSGAFSATEAHRQIDVRVARDPDAYLALNSVDSGGRAVIDGGMVRFSFPGAFEDGDAEGLNTDAEFWFDRDADGDPGDGVFTIQNQGSQPIETYAAQVSPPGKPVVGFFDAEDPDREVLNEDDPEELDVGEGFRVGVYINTHGVSVDESYEVNLQLVASGI